MYKSPFFRFVPHPTNIIPRKSHVILDEILCFDFLLTRKNYLYLIMQFLLEMVTPTWSMIFGFFAVFCILKITEHPSIIKILTVSSFNIRSGTTQELLLHYLRSTINKIFLMPSLTCSKDTICKVLLDNGAKLLWIMRASDNGIHKFLVDKLRYLLELFRHPDYFPFGPLSGSWPNRSASGSFHAVFVTNAARGKKSTLAYFTRYVVKFAEDDPPWFICLPWDTAHAWIVFMSLQDYTFDSVASDLNGEMMTAHTLSWLQQLPSFQSTAHRSLATIMRAGYQTTTEVHKFADNDPPWLVLSKSSQSTAQFWTIADFHSPCPLSSAWSIPIGDSYPARPSLHVSRKPPTGCMYCIPWHCRSLLVLWLLPQIATASDSAVWLLYMWEWELLCTMILCLFALSAQKKLLDALLVIAMWSICLSFGVADLLVTGSTEIVYIARSLLALTDVTLCTHHTSCGHGNDSASRTRSLSCDSLSSISTMDAHSTTDECTEGCNCCTISSLDDLTSEIPVSQFHLDFSFDAVLPPTTPSQFCFGTSSSDASRTARPSLSGSGQLLGTMRSKDSSTSLGGNTETSTQRSSVSLNKPAPPPTFNFTIGSSATPQFPFGGSDRLFGNVQSPSPSTPPVGDTVSSKQCLSVSLNKPAPPPTFNFTIGSSATPQFLFGGSGQLFGTMQSQESSTPPADASTAPTLPLFTEMDEELLYFTPTSPIVTRNAITPFVRLIEKALAVWRPGTTWKAWRNNMAGKYLIDCHVPNPWPRTLDDSIYEDLFSWWGPAWLFGERGLSTQSDDEVLRLYNERSPSIHPDRFLAPMVPMYHAMDDHLSYFTDTSPVVSRTAFTPSVPVTEKVLAAWSPGMLWQVWKVDMEGAEIIDSYHPNPWPRTLDDSIYEDLFTLLGPAWLFGEHGLLTQSDDYVQKLHTAMLPEIRSYICAFCSLPVVRIHEPSAWPRSMDKRIYNDLYRLWGPTWLYNTCFTTPRIPRVAAGKIPTANPMEVGFLSCSDSDIFEAHERLLPAIQQLREFPDHLPHCWGHWTPGMDMPERGLHWTFGWYWSEEEEKEVQGEEEEEDSSSPPASVLTPSQEMSKSTIEDCVLQDVCGEVSTAHTAQQDDVQQAPIHNYSYTNPCPCGIIDLSARAYRANRVFCGDPEEKREEDEEPPLSFCAAYSHLYNVRVNRPIELGHGLVRILKPPWYRPMWRKPGSHRRRPWPDVPTTKALHRYLGNPSADTLTPEPLSTTAILATFSTTDTSNEEADAYEPSPPELDSSMSQSEGSSSPLAILHDGYLLQLFSLISSSLLILCLVTWRVCWPLVQIIVRRAPRAAANGASALIQELRTDILCMHRGLEHGLWSMVTGAAAAGRATVDGAAACSVIFWRLFIAMEGDSSARIDSDSLAFCYFLSSIRNLTHVSISAVPTDILISSLAYSFVVFEPKLDRKARLRYTSGPHITPAVGMYSSYEGAYLLRVRLRTLCACATRMSVALSCALEYDKRVAFS